MSVIFGKCNFNGQPVDPADLHLMQSRLNHWQADKAATHIDAHAGLGHLLLYNTPQSLFENLPYHDQASQLTITADARLDNREELVKKLGLPPVDPLQITDSLLILKAYQKYGSQCMQHLIGDFAFVIHDTQKQQLFCGRDHLGVKPFFYSINAGYFAFASEKKGILSLPGFNKAIDKQYFFNHLIFTVEQNVEDTLYQHIKKLKPGHFLIVNLTNRSIIQQRYWTPDVHTELKLSNKNEYIEGLRHHFEQAVQCRTISNCKVGVELSGGLDSSAITGAAYTYLAQQHKSITTLSNTLANDITDPNVTKLDERRYIDSVIQQFNIQDALYITRPAFDNLADELRFGNEVNDGLERWNPLWQLPLKKAAQQHGIRTLLSGFPGDELVSYRGKYYFLDDLDHQRYFKYLFAKKKHPGFSKLEPLLPFKLRYAIHQLKQSFGIYSNSMAGTAALYTIPKEYQQHFNDSIWLDPYYQERFKSYRHHQRYRILKPQVTHRMESETRYGIYFRTEPRFPMADIRLIQYYLSMPNNIKYEGEQTRTTFRKAVAPYLSPMVLNRDDKYSSVAPFMKAYNRKPLNLINDLVKELPDMHFLKRDLYLQHLNQQRSQPSKTSFLFPPEEVMLWLNDNKDWLEDL